MKTKRDLTLHELNSLIADRAASDRKFRAQLLKEPSKVIMEEFGFVGPEGVDLHVVENTSSKLNIVLPLDNTQLADDEIKKLSPFDSPLKAFQPLSKESREFLRGQLEKTKDRPHEIPARAKETILRGLEEVIIPTWTFFGITNAWAFNEGNVTCIVEARINVFEYKAIDPGENDRFKIAGAGFDWHFKNCTQTDTVNNQFPLIRLFTW